jgi:hypothetical protein
MDHTWNYWNKSVVSGGGGNDIYNHEWRERERYYITVEKERVVV